MEIFRFIRWWWNTASLSEHLIVLFSIWCGISIIVGVFFGFLAGVNTFLFVGGIVVIGLSISVPVNYIRSQWGQYKKKSLPKLTRL